MKTTTVAIGAIVLAGQFAASQPHRRHFHADKHVKKNVIKREDVVVTVTDVVYANPTEAPEVIVFVNQFGEPVSTMTEGMLAYSPSIWSTKSHPTPTVAPSAPESTSTSVPTPTTTSTSAPPAPTTTSTSIATSTLVTSVSPAASAPAVNENIAVAATTSAAPVVVAPVASTQAAAPAATTSSSSDTAASVGSGYGFSWSPYQPDNTCKTQADANKDFAKIGKGYSIVRTYGTDCNQVAMVFNEAKTYGYKMFVGIYDITPANLQAEVKIISDAVGGDWSIVDTVSVGNELVNSGSASPAAVITAIGSVRSLLKTAGYTGPVVTVDTLVAMRTNPSLCDASDYCAVNCHPFFDSNTAATNAGNFLTTQIPTLKAVIADQSKKIVVTETGWPSGGDPNGNAVPSSSNQATALSSIKSAFVNNKSNVILFTAFNGKWKVDTSGTFGAEKFWGFLGDSPSD